MERGGMASAESADSATHDGGYVQIRKGRNRSPALRIPRSKVDSFNSVECMCAETANAILKRP